MILRLRIGGLVVSVGLGAYVCDVVYAVYVFSGQHVGYVML